MKATLASLARQVEARARSDADFARIVDDLLLAPTTPWGARVRVDGREVGEHCGTSSMRGFVGGPLDFAQMLDDLLLAPTTPRRVLEQVAARTLNERRRTTSTCDFIDGALPTSDVRHLLRYATSQAVLALLSQGKLLGMAIGHQTLFPAWQFDGDRCRADLPRILAALTRYTTDVVVADRVMRMARDELDGSSLSAALRDPGTAAVAWRLVESLGA